MTLFNVLLFLLIGVVSFVIIMYSLTVYINENARLELNNRTISALKNIGATNIGSELKSTYFIVPAGAIPLKIQTDSGYEIQLYVRGRRLFFRMSTNKIPVELHTKNTVEKTSYADKIIGTTLSYHAVELVSEQADEAEFLVSFYDSHNDDAIKKQVLELLIFVYLVGGSTLLIFSNILSRSALEPLTRLSNEARAIDFKKPEKRLINTESKDEVSALTESLNAMLDNIESSYQKTKQFTQDASHELRIPLTVILGNVELLEKFSSDPEIFSESLETIKSETLGMKLMIERMLTIARMERDNFEPKISRFNLCEMLSALASDFGSAHERELELYSEQIEVETDQTLLTQMLRAILDNAVKYSDDKIIITARISLQSISSYAENTAISATYGDANLDRADYSDGFSIKIKDFGKGIPKSDLANIKNRFYRADSSRNSQTGGTGLGLSIAELIAESLGGSIDIDSEVDKGTEVSVIFSRSARQAS